MADVDEDIELDQDPENGYWCLTCQGLGGWEESGEDVDFGDPEDVDCPCCGGHGLHYDGPCPPG